MNIQEQIKEELVKEVNADIDRIYVFMEERFVLSPEDEGSVILLLNRLKDRLYAIASNSELK